MVLADGSIVVGGRSLPGDVDTLLLAQLTPDGELMTDAGNQPDGTSVWVGSAIDPDISLLSLHEMVVLPNGQFLVAAGNVVSRFGGGENALFPDTRRNVDGTVDTAFGTNGTVSVPSDGGDGGAQVQPTGLALQPDGKIVASGALASGLNLDYWIGRFTP